MLMTPLFIGGIGMQEVLVIALVVLLFFDSRTDERHRKRCALVQGWNEQHRERNRGRANEKRIDEWQQMQANILSGIISACYGRPLLKARSTSYSAS